MIDRVCYTRFIDPEGRETWLQVAPAVAMVLAEEEPPLRERLFRRPEAIEQVASRPVGEPALKLRFTWLVGESRTWQGEPVVTMDGERYCTICWDRALPKHAYCLGCDRCGRELDVPGRCEVRDGERRPKFKPRIREKKCVGPSLVLT